MPLLTGEKEKLKILKGSFAETASYGYGGGYGVGVGYGVGYGDGGYGGGYGYGYGDGYVDGSGGGSGLARAEANGLVTGEEQEAP